MIKAITSADLQQLAQGIVPAYLQRYPLPELVQELATRLVYAENVINDAYYNNETDPEKRADEILTQLDEYEEQKEC